MFPQGAVALLCAAALIGCSKAPSSMPVPAPPSTLTYPDEYAFGDIVGAADQTLQGHVIDQLQPQFGRPSVMRYTAPADTDFAALKSHYAQAAAKAGWQPVESLGKGLPAGEQAFGFEREGAAFAVAWLAPRGDTPLVPVNVIRFGS